MTEQPRKTELEKRLEAQLAASPKDGHPVGQPGPTSPTGAEPDEESFEAVQDEEFDALVAECNELKDQLLRARAEFDNYRKRMAREAERVRKTAAEGVVRELLPVVDHLELALQHRNNDPAALADGVKLVLNQFLEVLGRWGVEPIPAVGQPFDPAVHEAVLQRTSDEAPAHVVLDEFAKGYRLGDLVLRPTKVVVNAGAPGEAFPQEEISMESPGGALPAPPAEGAAPV